MAAINYCATFSSSNSAEYFRSIVERLSSEVTTTSCNGNHTVCFRICLGSCDTTMIRDLAVNTCCGTFACAV